MSVTIPTGAPAGTDFAGQPLWHVATAAPGAEVRLVLYAESAHGAEDFAPVMALRKSADAGGQVPFRLDALLWPLLRPFVLPAATPQVTVRCTANLLNYFVTTQVLGQPDVVTGPLRTALRGSLPAEWRGLDYWDAYRLDRFGTPPFLSWQPTGAGRPLGLSKRITAQQPEWLFWLCPPGTPAQLRVRRSYTTSGGVVVQDEAVTLTGERGTTGQLLALPARPAAVAGAQQLTVALESSQGEALSALARFELVPAREQTRYLVFTNSLGTCDTLRCEGKLDATLEAKTEQTERPDRFGDGPGQATRQVYTLDASRKLRLATGWLTAAELAWLQELLLAREAWLLDARLGLLPLELTKRSLNYVSDDTPLRGLLIECDYAYEPTAYANPL